MNKDKKNQELKELIISSFSLESSTKDEQDAVITRVDILAHKKVLGLLEDILDEEALARLGKIDKDNDDAFLAAVDMELAHYDLSYFDLVSAAIEDICKETKENTDQFMAEFNQRVKEEEAAKKEK